MSRRDDSGDFRRGQGGVRLAGGLDRVYLAGTGDLKTLASAEVHYTGDSESASSSGGNVGGVGGPRPPPPPPPPPRRGAAVFPRGAVVVEATCSRAATETWSEATPSPDLVLVGGLPSGGVSSGGCGGEGEGERGSVCGGGDEPTGAKSAPRGDSREAMKKQVSSPDEEDVERVVCVAPGLISSPVRSLVNGRMTLTQTIAFLD